MNDAQTSKAPIQDYADYLAGYFVPGVMILSALTFLVWYFIAWPLIPNSDNVLYFSLKLAISVLIVACPCGMNFHHFFSL